MKTINLNDEYERCKEMCEGTALEKTPWKCVQYLSLFDWHDFGDHPNFKFCNPMHVKFALGVLEGEPVFIGNCFYRKRDGEMVVALGNDGIYLVARIDGEVRTFCLHDDIFSWDQPEPARTIKLGGRDLPCPVANYDESMPYFIFSGTKFAFRNETEMKETCMGVLKILVEARDKS